MLVSFLPFRVNFPLPFLSFNTPFSFYFSFPFPFLFVFLRLALRLHKLAGNLLAAADTRFHLRFAKVLLAKKLSTQHGAALALERPLAPLGGKKTNEQNKKPEEN